MKNNAIPLAERRQHLLAQVALQRIALAQGIEPWRMPLAVADQGLNALRYVRRHPVLLVGGLGLLAALWPGRTWTWLRRGWGAWWVMHRLRDG